MFDLKPCPFCGAEAELHSNYSEKKEAYYIFVQCTNCLAKGFTTKRNCPSAIGINEFAAHDSIAA